MAHRHMFFWMMPEEFPGFFRAMAEELDVSFVAKSAFELDGLIAGEVVDLDNAERMKLYRRVYVRCNPAEALEFDPKSGELHFSLDWAKIDLPRVPDRTVIPSQAYMETGEPGYGGRGYEHREKLYAAIRKRIRKRAHLTVYCVDPLRKTVEKHKMKCSEAVRDHIAAGGRMDPLWSGVKPFYYTPILPKWALASD